MAATVRRGTLTAGLMLITIGLVFFLENWYESFSIWHLIGRYWPVILILVGLNKLYGYFTWQEAISAPEVSAKE
jgi:lia operon protein LiaF